MSAIGVGSRARDRRLLRKKIAGGFLGGIGGIGGSLVDRIRGLSGSLASGLLGLIDRFAGGFGGALQEISALGLDLRDQAFNGALLVGADGDMLCAVWR